MFKVGDIITGNTKSNSEYSYTNENGVYEVVRVGNHEHMTIKVIEHECKFVINEKFSVKSRYFKLLRRTQTTNYIGENNEI